MKRISAVACMALLINLKDGDSAFPRNVSELPPDFTAPHPR
jgi:hypothetical protein